MLIMKCYNLCSSQFWSSRTVGEVVGVISPMMSLHSIHSMQIMDMPWICSTGSDRRQESRQQPTLRRASSTSINSLKLTRSSAESQHGPSSHAVKTKRFSTA